MSNNNPADGTYILVGGKQVDPSVFANFRDNTEGLNDYAILNAVRYVPPDSPDIPENQRNAMASVKAASKIPGMQCRLALWPDDVCAWLCFPNTQPFPRDMQLIRAYRNARHAKCAVEFYTMSKREHGHASS